MSDIICGRTGRHYSSWEALEECRKHCNDCPFDHPITSHKDSKRSDNDTLTAEDIDRIFGTGYYTKSRKNNKVREYKTKDGRTFLPYSTKKEYSRGVNIVTYIVMAIIGIFILGVIGGIIYGLVIWIT